MRLELCLASPVAAVLLCAAPQLGHAGTPEISADAAPARSIGDITDNVSVRLGLESAGPLLFTDTADQRLERTTVFQYGGRLAFLFGDEHRDTHRMGIAFAYSFVAKSESRSLGFGDGYLMYETGRRWIMQLHAGASLATGTKALKEDHGNLYSAIGVRYSFDRAQAPSAFRVSPGLIAKSYLRTQDMRHSSFFVGAQLEFSYNTNK